MKLALAVTTVALDGLNLFPRFSVLDAQVLHPLAHVGCARTCGRGRIGRSGKLCVGGPVV